MIRNQLAPVILAVAVLTLMPGCASKSGTLVAPPLRTDPGLPALKSSATTVSVLGQVRKATLDWRNDMTLSDVIVESQFLSPTMPTTVKIIRNGHVIPVNPGRLQSGKENPPIEPGDVVDLR